MDAPSPNGRQPFIVLGATGFIVLMLLPLMTRNIHFVIDDWEFLQIPFYNDTLHSIIGAINRKLRVSREVYMALELKLLGMDRHAMMYVSVGLHWLNAMLFGAVLLQAFPARPRFSLAATALALAFPPLVAITFFAIDSTRMPLTLTFASALLLQRWARHGRTWPLAAAAGAYFLAQTFYENAIFFAPLLPMAALPILLTGQERLFSRPILVKLFAMLLVIGAAGLVFLFYRNVLGFIDTSRTGTLVVPSAATIQQSLQSTLAYLVQPILELKPDSWAALAGTLLAISLGFLLWKAPPLANRNVATKEWGSAVVVASLGAAMFFFGLLPYWLIDYAAPPAWTVEARILSSAGYGLVLLLALPFLLPLNRVAALLAGLAVSALAGAWLAFGFGLRLDWQVAADRHCLMWRSLIEQVPEVTENTAFLFDDLRDRDARAIVFGGSDSVQVLVSMLYRRPGIVQHVFGYNWDEQVAVTPRGLKTSRSQAFQGGDISFDSLILVRRQDDRLQVVDSFAPQLGVSTNRARIVPTDASAPDTAARLARLSIHCPP